MNRGIRVLSCFLAMGVLILGLALGMTCKKKNQPPGAPSIPSGPTSGRKGDTLRFSTVAEDPDGDSVAVRFDWGDSTMSDWSSLVPSGDSVAMTRRWDSAGTFSIRAQARDTRDIASAWSGGHYLTIPVGPDRAPSPPSVPSGPTSGRKGDTLCFSTIAEDPDGDSVAVRFDWGDSTMSDWSALVPSGDSVTMTHAWQKLGTYSIRVLAKDSRGAISNWSGEHQLAVASFIETFGDRGGWDRGTAVLQTSDGGYVVAGITESFGAQGSDVGLIRTDGSGNLVWVQTIGGSGGDGAYSLWRTSDGGYVMAGATSSFGAGGSDCFLLRTDLSGNELWHKTFGGSGQEEAYSVLQTSDGGYVLVGFTQGSAS